MGQKVEHDWMAWPTVDQSVCKVKVHRKGGVYVSFETKPTTMGDGYVDTYRIPKRHLKWMHDIMRMYKKACKEALNN